MLASGFLTGLLTVLFVVVCILLILCILLQKGKGGGLGAAFGGASSTFGTKTGDIFTGITIVLTAVFLLSAIFMGFLYRPNVEQLMAPAFAPPEPGKIGEENKVFITSKNLNANIHYRVNDQDFMVYDGETPVAVPVGGRLEAYCSREGFRDKDSTHVFATYGVELSEEATPPAVLDDGGEDVVTPPAEGDMPVDADAPVEAAS